MKLNFLNIITMTYVWVLFSCNTKHYEKNPFQYYNQYSGGMSVATAERKFGEIKFYSGMRINDILHILGNPSTQLTDTDTSNTTLTYSAGDLAWDPIEAENKRVMTNYTLDVMNQQNKALGGHDMSHLKTPRPRGRPPEIRNTNLMLTFIKNKLVKATINRMNRGNNSSEVIFTDTMALQENFRTQLKARGHSDEDVDHALEMQRLDKLYRSGKISRQEMIKRATAINKKYFSVE